MTDSSNRLVMLLLGLASVVIILFGIRNGATIINPILLSTVITITVLPVPSKLTRRGLPGWLALVLTILLVVFILALVILTVYFSITRLSTELPQYLDSASARMAEMLPSTQADSGVDSSTSTAVAQMG